VPLGATLSCEEAFGPVTTIEPYKDFKDVIQRANKSRFGLQAGVFTQSLDHAFYAYENLHQGGVVINDVPSVRVDSQPYGGIKASGVGREGVKYTMQEYTELKIMTLRDVGKL